jgi:hypothetical protein
MTFNPSLHVYTTVLDYILSNKATAAAIKPANINRYDQVRVKQQWKQNLAPADLPDLIFQQIGFTRNHRASGGATVELYDFQATITTNAWHLESAIIAHDIMDWLYDGQDNGQLCGLDWGENRGWYKCEILPMRVVNHMDTNRNLSGFVYAINFNIQLDAQRGF